MARAATAWPRTYAGAVPTRFPCRWTRPLSRRWSASRARSPSHACCTPSRSSTTRTAGSLPTRLWKRIDAWEEAQERKAEKDGLDDELVTYHHDLSIPQGCRVGGFPSWHTTDPYPVNCEACAAPMVLLLTVDSREWDGANGSWMPTEEWDVAGYLRDHCPTKRDRRTAGLCSRVWALPGLLDAPSVWVPGLGGAGEDVQETVSADREGRCPTPRGSGPRRAAAENRLSGGV